MFLSSCVGGEMKSKPTLLVIPIIQQVVIFFIIRVPFFEIPSHPDGSLADFFQKVCYSFDFKEVLAIEMLQIPQIRQSIIASVLSPVMEFAMAAVVWLNRRGQTPGSHLVPDSKVASHSQTFSSSLSSLSPSAATRLVSR